ncbi:MAG: hypothetical protein PHE27_05035 [Alphaproteobacteria bacterium]|nr:hypothetical protein [Alphaproteobacteria bacterium]
MSVDITDYLKNPSFDEKANRVTLEEFLAARDASVLPKRRVADLSPLEDILDEVIFGNNRMIHPKDLPGEGHSHPFTIIPFDELNEKLRTSDAFRDAGENPYRKFSYRDWSAAVEAVILSHNPQTRALSFADDYRIIVDYEFGGTRGTYVGIGERFLPARGDVFSEERLRALENIDLALQPDMPQAETVGRCLESEAFLYQLLDGVIFKQKRLVNEQSSLFCGPQIILPAEELSRVLGRDFASYRADIWNCMLGAVLEQHNPKECGHIDGLFRLTVNVDGCNGIFIGVNEKLVPPRRSPEPSRPDQQLCLS